MLYIDVVKSGSLYETIGPVGTLKRILKNRRFFIEKGLDISVYNQGFFYSEWTEADDWKPKGGKPSLKRRIRSMIDNWAKYSFWLSALLVEKEIQETQKIRERLPITEQDF